MRSRRSRSGRRRLAAAAAVLLLLAGALLATVARPARSVSATADGLGGAPVVVTAPGLLDDLGGRVVVRASGPGRVLVAVGTADDVAAWAEGAATTEVARQDDGRLTSTTSTGELQVPDPSGSDLWTAQAVGTGSAELSASPGTAPASVLVASDGASPAPEQVELTWTEHPVPLAAWLLLGAGAALAVLSLVSRRRRREVLVVDLPLTGPATGPVPWSEVPAAAPARQRAADPVPGAGLDPGLAPGASPDPGPAPVPELLRRPRGRERRSAR